MKEKILRRFAWFLFALGILILLLLGFTDPARAQGNAFPPDNGPYETGQYTLLPQNAVPLITLASVSPTTATGTTSYYYWIVTHDITNARFSIPAGPFFTNIGPPALSATASIFVQWTPYSVPLTYGQTTPNGTSFTTSNILYDVLETATPIQPGGTCNCAVEIGSGNPTATDTGSYLGYTVNVPAWPGNYPTQGDIAAFGPNGSLADGGPASASVTTPPVVVNGLIGDYRFLVGESPCTVPDHSGQGNNATGCVGVSPTIAPNTGGLLTSRNGAVVLPASMNGALTIQAEVVFQTTGLSQGAYDPVICAGTPATSGTGIVISTDVTSAGLFGSIGTVNDDVGSHKNDFQNNGRQFDSTFVPLYGLGDVTFVMTSAPDIIYVNGVKAVLGQSGGAAGACNSGSYQIGGAAAGSGSSVITYFSGTIVRVLIYNRQISAVDAATNHNALQAEAFSRGFNLSALSNNILPVVIAIGDSETVGSSGAVTYTSTPMVLNNFANIANRGVSGFKVADLINLANPTYRPIISTNAQVATIVMSGANDTPCSTFTTQLTALGNTLRSYGSRVFVTTVADYGGSVNDAQKNCENLFIRTQWPTFADDEIDIAANPNIGGDGVTGNLLFWQTGNLHYTTHSYSNILTPDAQQHVNRYFGNHDWTTAATYASPAGAAVATTNATETGTIMTFTFVAETFAAGQQMFCGGISPPGYNGKWYIRTANATTVTAFNGTTGLGNQTVAGTCQVPQQLDQDANYNINFGTGNTIPESCESWTGQNIYIKNLNAAASTFLPFAGETVDVSTIPGNAISVFQVKLVTPSTPVCSWVRLLTVAVPPSVSAYSVTTESSDTVLTSGTPAVVITKVVTMPSSGCPCRASTVWMQYLTSTGSGQSADLFVSDGTVKFAEGEREVDIIGNAASQTGSGYSPVTYANSAVVTFTLTIQVNGTGTTAKAASFQSLGMRNSRLEIAVFPSN